MNDALKYWSWVDIDKDGTPNVQHEILVDSLDDCLWRGHVAFPSKIILIFLQLTESFPNMYSRSIITRIVYQIGRTDWTVTILHLWRALLFLMSVIRHFRGFPTSLAKHIRCALASREAQARTSSRLPDLHYTLLKGESHENKPGKKL
jgi:hypothetical protein